MPVPRGECARAGSDMGAPRAVRSGERRAPGAVHVVSSRKERHKRRRHTERLIEDAFEALADREPGVAEKLVTRALDSGAMNPMVWCEAGELYVQLGKPELAKNALHAALRLAPGLE